MHKLLLLGVVAAITLPLAASAAPHRKPGLWETSIQMKITKGGPKISAEQLAKMKQLGVATPFAGGPPHVEQECLTPAEAAKDDNPDLGDENCKLQDQAWSGNNFSANMVCHGEGAEAHGTIQASFNGDKSYTGSIHTEGSNPTMGGAYAMESQVSGKWLSADCGSVAPDSEN